MKKILLLETEAEIEKIQIKSIQNVINGVYLDIHFLTSIRIIHITRVRMLCYYKKYIVCL